MQRFRATYDRPQLIRKADVSIAGMWRKAVLTFPCLDIAGDYVDPAGLNFSPHQADPSIDLEHGRRPDARGMPVAWARESLSKPGAPYAVEYKSLNIADEGQPAKYHDLPIGTNYFDPGCPISTQVFALVEQDVFPGVSLEFQPIHGCMKAIGRTPLEARPILPDPYAAYRFDKVNVTRWTICATPVNPNALSVLKAVGTGEQVPSALCKILSDKRVNVGGKLEPLHGYILKALAPWAELAKPNRTTVRVEQKAMDSNQQQPAPDDAQLQTQNEGAVDEMQQDDGPALGGVSAKYKFAQAIMDACGEYEQDMQSSDSPELRKMAEKFMQMAQKLASNVKGAADKHDARLNGDPDADLDPDTESEGDDTDDGDEEGDDDAEGGSKKKKPDMEKDDDGVLKSMRTVYKSILVKRFREADMRPVSVAKPPVKKANPESDELAKTVREFRKWQKHAS